MWKAVHILQIIFSLERRLLFLVRICRLCHLRKPSNLLIQGKNSSVVKVLLEILPFRNHVNKVPREIVATSAYLHD